MSILAALLSSKWLVGIGAAIAAVIGAWLHGRSSGKTAEQNAQTRKEADAIEAAHEIQSDIGALPPEAVKRDLGKWSRS